MARIGKVEAHQKKVKLVEKYKTLRRELRAKLKDTRLSDEERTAARKKMDSLPRNSAEIRVRNRCEVTGHPRAYMRKFKLSRREFRRLALKGLLPGVTKSSW